MILGAALSLAGAAGAVSIVVFAFIKGQMRSFRAFEAAQKSEADQRYEEAAYKYGEAMVLSIFSKGSREVCQARVRELWKRHGPFEFAKLRNQYSTAGKSQVEFFDETVRLIKNAVNIT